ncbi:FKBP-type peptidyl-prolyl cis-trans isomerase [Aeromicrobium sp. Sec7.5]|uniref:FKBP-type peptidyl-prolyl cis-trans isomerase n=1 Tax=Aeromicrobium sp. Sec7.5 TaxID=3121276 RepID=UPI002FE4F069
MRRNTVLALSTVVVMAVVAALLIVLTRGGDDGISGVTVSDGDVPTITVDQPVEIESGDPEVSTLEEGDGRKVAEGDYFRANYIFADGEDGEQLESSYEPAAEGAPAASVVFEMTPTDEAASPSAPGLPGGLVDALADTTVGSTVLVALTAEDFFGADVYEQAEAQGGVDQLPYTKDQVLLFYLDIEDSIDTQADPAPKGDETDVPAGVPAPVVDGDGVASLDGSTATGPAADGVFPVITGDGDTVEADDFVYANYVGQIYPSGEVFDSSFERDEPSLFSLTGVIPCWTNELAGQTVGSRVVLTCTSESAYGAGGGAGGAIPPNSPLTFVVDIVATI